MKIKAGDILAVLYFLAYTGLVLFFPLEYVKGDGFYWCFSCDPMECLNDNFVSVVNQCPYISGFLKVGLLATFGEMLKMRGRTGSWKTPDLFPKFLVWGMYGMLFTIVFALFGYGVGAVMGSPIWPLKFENEMAQRIWQGFSTSLWANLIFCFPMMLSHEYWNTCITKKRFLGGGEFLEAIDKHVWGSFMLKSIVIFWIPAHTITFSLPKPFQVLMSAYLSLALGFILTIKPKKKAD